MPRQKIKYFLTHQLKISNKETDKLILAEKIQVNNKIISENILISEWDEVKCGGKILQSKKEKLYFLFHKPRGIESTLSETIENSLVTFLPKGEKLFYVGRLDKESEGLMLLTNDGSISKNILEGEVEKEYSVEVDPYHPENKLDELFRSRMENGIEIIGKITKPCKVKILSEKKFNIILTEGKNRQIRRMCHKIGMKVISLKRLRIGNLNLEDLEPGRLKKIQKENFIY